jgi:hypothetical protein
MSLEAYYLAAWIEGLERRAQRPPVEQPAERPAERPAPIPAPRVPDA